MSPVAEDLVLDWYKKFEAIPDDGRHLLCPKLSDDDDEDYDDLTESSEEVSLEEKKQRVEDGNDRLDVTYWNCLLMAYGHDGGGEFLRQWNKRVEQNLHSCDKCVTNWHMNRKKYLRTWGGLWDDEVVQKLTNMLHRYDFPRIQSGLQWAHDQIDKAEREGRQFTKKDLGDQQARVLIAVFEALCCMPYMSVPDKRAGFQRIFERLSSKKPLKLGENVLLPAMTYFLFEDDPTRRDFATRAYERIPPQSVTQKQFDWAIHDELLEVLARAATWDPNDSSIQEQAQRFWQGINYILQTLNGEVMLQGLRSLDIKPNIVELLFGHIHFRSEAILLFALQAMSSILRTAPRLMRDTILDARPFVIVEQIFVTPLFRRLLSQSVTFSIQGQDNPAEIVCHAVAWIGDWIRSIPLNEKSDACEQLLHLLYTKEINNDSLGDEGKVACVRAGLDALEHVLQAFLEPTVSFVSGSASLYANQVLCMMLKHKDVINRALNDTREVAYSLGLQASAMKVIKSSLTLDTRIMMAEHRELRREDSGTDAKKPVSLQTAVLRDSAAIWEACLENLSMGKRRLAQHMVTAMSPLISLDRFRPKQKKDPNSIDASRKRLNEELRKTSAVCGKVLSRLCDFSKDDLLQLWLIDQQARIIFALTLHSEEDLRDASREVVMAISDEVSFSDALKVELSKRMEITLASLNFGVLQITGVPMITWGFASNVISTSRQVLEVLCDESTGILRSRVLEPGEEKALSTWWTAQWKYIEKSFGMTSQWSHEVEVEIMKNFCRSTIELADILMGQVGLISAALQQKSQKLQLQAGNDADGNGNVMHELLKEPRNRLLAIVHMIRLRDTHLVGVTVKVVVNLLTRLRENKHEIPKESKTFIQKACRKLYDGRYELASNVGEQDKAELLKALGDDDDEVEVVEVRPRQKQTTIDAWSKSGASTSTASGTSTPTARTNRDDVLELTSNVDKLKSSSVLSQLMAAKPSTKPKVPPVKAKPAPVVMNRALIESRKQAAADLKKQNLAAAERAKALRSNEVKGLSGIVGKEHAPQKSVLMVDSDEEDADDSDDDADTQRLIKQGEKGQKAVDAATRRRELALLEKTKGPVKKTRVQRSAKDMRARLIPPMDQLHQAILEWDIFYEGNDPPNVKNCSRVADTYSSPDQYKQTFWLLLVSEAWRSFVTSKDETTSKVYGIKIASRMNVDRFLEITASMPVAENREHRLSEGDIVLLSQSRTPLTDPGAPHALARIWKTTFKRDILEVTYRLNSKNNPLQSSLQISAELQAAKITNMTTIEREYAALESLKYYDLMDEVLKAKPSPVLKYGDELVNNCMSNYGLNPGQAKAILGARDNDGFTLIQGPPGTGKTKTIVAMVGCLLTGHISQNGGVAVSAPASKQTPSTTGNKKKILVCAPSNAAVDELVVRLKEGVTTLPDSKQGSKHMINVLRLGRSEAINAAVRDVTLDELVKKRMDGDTTKATMLAERDKMHADAASIKAQVDDLRQQLMASEGNEGERLALQRRFDALKQDQRRIGQKIDEQKESGNTISREIEIKRKRVQQEILDSAQVLCATLSGSGHEMFKNLSVDFETVIIDEAAQCVELSALIPLKYGCCKCILVGDPKQLPPTVLSQSAARFGYDQSLFVRMQRNHPDAIHLLDRQYRMHPAISLFPSQEFYEGKLIDGKDMAIARNQPWHASPLLGPYRFFDVEGNQQSGRKGQSLVNMEEVQVAIQLYRRFLTDHGRDADGNDDIRGKVGIITPYKAQLQELRLRFRQAFHEEIEQDIEFNTTDAFQGRECEIIIFSCVRASSTGGIGFMRDIRRMNVGLTRAKSSLWILGDSRALVQGEFWNKLIENAKDRNLYTKGNILSMLRKPGVTPTARALPSAQDVAMQGTNPQPTNAPGHSAPDQSRFGRDMGRGYDSIDSQGQEMPSRPRGDGPPQILPPPPKKRPREGEDDAAHNAKRIHSGSDRPPPTGPKDFRERKPKQATDPSAMAALQMTAPTRPPAAGTNPDGRISGPTPPTGMSRVNQIQQNSGRPQMSGPRPPKPKKQGGNSMFIPNKKKR